MSSTPATIHDARRRVAMAALGAVFGALAALAGAAPAGAQGSRATVAVYPSPGTPTASARAQISVRGATAAQVGRLRVVGSRTGRHPGRVLAHSDGAGASFVPTRPFRPGERVTVRTGLRVAGATGGVVRFTIAGVSRARPEPVPPANPARAPGAVQRFRSLPGLNPPALRVTTNSAPASGDFFIAPKAGESDQGPMIIDGAGGLVWFKALPDDQQAFDFRVQTYRAQPVLTWWQGRTETFHGIGEGVIFDTAYRQIARVRAGNGYTADLHEFLLTPRGTAYLTIYTPVPWSLSRVGGPRRGTVYDGIVQEVDVPTGAVLFEWHSLGRVPITDAYTEVPTTEATGFDYFHVNSVDEEPNGDLLISGRHTQALYEVKRATGRIVWRVGGKRSSFRMGHLAHFHWQHDARRQPDGTITLYDNQAGEIVPGRQSRALTIRVDPAAKTVTGVRQIHHPGGVLSPSQGNAQTLPNREVVVGWGGRIPFFSEFDATGKLVFDARFLARDVETYRAYRLPWAARPATRPDIAAVTRGGRTTAFASWNGATDVASWSVLAGPNRGALRRRAIVRRSGFETAMRLPFAARWVAVRALDAAGGVLASSRAVRPSAPRRSR
jgi:hypothetical protein